MKEHKNECKKKKNEVISKCRLHIKRNIKRREKARRVVILTAFIFLIVDRKERLKKEKALYLFFFPFL